MLIIFACKEKDREKTADAYQKGCRDVSVVKMK